MFNRLTIELTNCCNLLCAPCPRHRIKMDHGYMTEKLFYRLLDQCPPDTTIIPFWRGESLLHPQVIEFLYYAISRKMKVVLATNGSRMEKLVFQPNLINKLHAISVSLHNIDSYTTYLWLKEISNINVQLSYVEGEVVDIPKELMSYMNLRRYKQHSFNGVWGNTGALPVSYQDWCQRLDTDLVVTWDGKVSRCCYVWEPIQGLDANIQTLEEIQNDPRYSRIITAYPDDICSKCDQWRGGGKTL
jgi:hypothetical protein